MKKHFKENVIDSCNSYSELGKQIYKLRFNHSKTNLNVYSLVRRELESKRKKILMHIEKKDHKEVLNILNRCCFKYMMPKSEFDETSFTPYSTDTMERYHLNSYLNVSEIAFNDKVYLATQVPSLKNMDTLIKLIHNSNTNTIVSLILDNKHLKNYNCLSSKKVFYGNEILLYDEIYDLDGHTVRLFRFVNWIDHSVIEKDQIEVLYQTLPRIEYPLLVHCRAGVGRTGFFIMYDILRDRGTVNVDEFLNVLFLLRSSRNGLVWSESQLSYLIELFIERK